MNARTRLPKPRSFWLVAVLALWAAATGRAFAEFREAPYESYIDADLSRDFVNLAFGPGGFFSTAGGVVFNGQAKFFLEDSKGQQGISPAQVDLEVGQLGNVYLSYRGLSYQLEIHKGLACPLGRFINRNGLIAFTVPPEVPSSFVATQTSLLHQAGLVAINEGLIANEFKRSGADELLVETDFAETVPLPEKMVARLIQSINAVLGQNRTGINDVTGSYVNTDSMVTYQVYLTANDRHVAIAGLPLRFFWDHANDGSAVVQEIEVYSSEWPRGVIVADLIAKDPTTQYDYVTLYQIEGVLRQIKMSNPDSFGRFVKRACDG
jgi:hypothetical protein